MIIQSKESTPMIATISPILSVPGAFVDVDPRLEALLAIDLLDEGVLLARSLRRVDAPAVPGVVIGEGDVERRPLLRSQRRPVGEAGLGVEDLAELVVERHRDHR